MSHPFVPIKKAELVWKDNLPYSLDYDDIYHSKACAIEQSKQVFIQGNDLENRLANLLKESYFTIGETGFGCGLNFLSTCLLWTKVAPQGARLHFISCEKHPLSLEDLKKVLALWPQLQPFSEDLIAQYPILTPGFHQLFFASHNIQLTLMLGDGLFCYDQLLLCKDPKLEAQLRTASIDAWFLDGFAPSKNEALWSESLFKTIAMLSKGGTTLATYTASGKVRNGLAEVGFEVEKKPGFGPKRHRIIAKFAKANFDIPKKITPWHVGLPHEPKVKEAIVLGAGLSGCFIAHMLALRGWKVFLIEEKAQIAKGASANQQAVLFPLLSSYHSSLSQLMLESFLYASTFYKKLLDRHSIGQLTGMLQLSHNEKESKAQHSLISWLQSYPELGSLVDEMEASKLLGLEVDKSGLFVPNSGWIDSQALCNVLINHENISLYLNQKVGALTYENNAWQVGDLKAPIMVLANGYQLNQFMQTNYLPVKSIRGQMTAIKATLKSKTLKIPLCAEGHVLPEINGMHSCGATYELGCEEAVLYQQDDEANLLKLGQLSKEDLWSKEVVTSWAGIRASLPDYLPVVGPVAIKASFEAIFADLKYDSNRWIAKPGPYYPGLYCCAGFGSRGLTTIPLCANWLAGLINQEMDLLPRDLVQAISPARFLRRKLLRAAK